MPVAKINVLERQYDKDRLGKVSSAVQNALIAALGIPPEDFFQIFHVLPRCQFLPTPSFLGLMLGLYFDWTNPGSLWRGANAAENHT